MRAGGGVRPTTRQRGVAIIGATGSIGTQALDVIARHGEHLRVVALAAGNRWREAAAAAVATGAQALALAEPAAAAEARAQLAGSGIQVLSGADGVDAVAAWADADVTLVAATGLAGLRPVLTAVATGRDVALANKESLVAGGALVTAAARRSGARLLPVDGEHCGLFQCLHGRDAAGVSRLWLTASGGPFRTFGARRLRGVTPQQALCHPTWRMGPRITIDCATLINKGFEVIEASWLFGVATPAVRVVVHPQSVVHALVEFVDGSCIAQCSHPDMRLPIAFALGYPERWAQTAVPALDLAALGRLTFEPPDLRRFPCLALAYQAAELGGLAPARLNAADEVAVARFLRGEIGFADIPRLLTDVVNRLGATGGAGLEGILEADAQARAEARAWRPRRGGVAVARGKAVGS